MGGKAGCLRFYGKSSTLNIGDVFKALLGLDKTHPSVEAVLPVSRGFHTGHLRNKVWTFFHVAVDASSCRASCWHWVRMFLTVKGQSRNIFSFAGHEL